MVKDLAARNIKEKLITYSIEDIEYQDDGSVRVFVYEKIGILYPPSKSYVIKEFYWIYTVRDINGELGLSDIEKWQKK